MSRANECDDTDIEGARKEFDVAVQKQPKTAKEALDSLLRIQDRMLTYALISMMLCLASLLVRFWGGALLGFAVSFALYGMRFGISFAVVDLRPFLKK